MNYKSVKNSVITSALAAIVLAVVPISANAANLGPSTYSRSAEVDADTYVNFEFGETGDPDTYITFREARDGNHSSYRFSRFNIRFNASIDNADIEQTVNGLSAVDGQGLGNALSLEFQRGVRLRNAQFRFKRASDNNVLELAGSELLNNAIFHAQFNDINNTSKVTLNSLDDNQYFLHGLTVYEWGNGDRVPEPLTVVATVMGGVSVLGMRKKLAGSASSPDNKLNI